MNSEDVYTGITISAFDDFDLDEGESTSYWVRRTVRVELMSCCTISNTATMRSSARALEARGSVSAGPCPLSWMRTPRLLG